MAPRRKNADLKLKSVWDEHLIVPLLPLVKHRNKLWNYLIAHCKPEHCDNSSDKRHVGSFADIPFREMTLPLEASRVISSEFSLFTTTVVARHESARGDTTKLVVRLQDGHEVETVVIRHLGHATVCLSSQIGCQMGCRFCATGTMGIIGDLTAGEIVEQLIHANSVTRIRNAVMMGMGEPLNNFDNVKAAVEFMIDSRRFAMAARHVTVSTVGVLKNMTRLSDELPNVNLALSLHAPNQTVRISIVPAGRAHHIDRLMEAVDYHILKNGMAPLSKEVVAAEGAAQGALAFSLAADPQDQQDQDLTNPGRRGRISGVMIEYILIRGINDTDEHAHELAALLLPRRQHLLLNLIPYNPTDVAEDYAPPLKEQVDSFFAICSGAPYFIYTRRRQEMGQDIAGACGQLALVRGNNTSSEPAADLEDIGSKKQKNNASSPSPPVPVPAVPAASGSVLDDVLRGYEVHSHQPLEDSWLRRRAQRCRVMVLSNLLIPLGLLLAGDLLFKQ